MRGRSFFPVLALAAIASVAASAATHTAQNNTIRGKVRSTSGVTLNNAIVELRIGGGGIIGQTVTRNDGDFAFSSLSAGEYEIVVSLAGYEPTIEFARFKLPPSSTSMEVLRVDIMLKARADAAMAAPGINFAQEVPKDARAAYEKALGKARENRPAEAIALLREAIALFGEYFNAHYELGSELYRAGKYDEALEALERARQINDRQAGVYHLFGLVMVKQQKFAVAEYAFREAIRLDASSAASHFYRAVALIEVALRGTDAAQASLDLAQAEKALDRVWELSNKRASAVLPQRARIHEIRGEKEAAARALEQYLKMEPDARNASEIKAMIRRIRGEKKK